MKRTPSAVTSILVLTVATKNIRFLAKANGGWQ